MDPRDALANQIAMTWEKRLDATPQTAQRTKADAGLLYKKRDHHAAAGRAVGRPRGLLGAELGDSGLGWDAALLGGLGITDGLEQPTGAGNDDRVEFAMAPIDCDVGAQFDCLLWACEPAGDEAEVQNLASPQKGRNSKTEALKLTPERSGKYAPLTRAVFAAWPNWHRYVKNHP